MVIKTGLIIAKLLLLASASVLVLLTTVLLGTVLVARSTLGLLEVLVLVGLTKGLKLGDAELGSGDWRPEMDLLPVLLEMGKLLTRFGLVSSLLNFKDWLRFDMSSGLRLLDEQGDNSMPLEFGMTAGFGETACNMA